MLLLVGRATTLVLFILVALEFESSFFKQFAIRKEQITKF